MTRAANRTNTDALLTALLGRDDAFADWYYLDEMDHGLSGPTALQTAKFLAAEYGAVRLLPVTKAVMANREGLERYLEVRRLYCPDHAWPEERTDPGVASRRASRHATVVRMHGTAV